MKLCKDSQDFISRCSKMVAAYEHDVFNEDQPSFLEDHGIESPIEQILHTAFRTLMQINGFQDAEPEEVNGKPYIIGFDLKPQVKIGKYRVDFLASKHHYPVNPKNPQKVVEVIVECDSQEFHERTEKERRYEKERDRFLQSQGYRTFHFTGKEIKDTPFEVAAEILSHLTNRSAENIIDHNYIQGK